MHSELENLNTLKKNAEKFLIKKEKMNKML